GGATRGQARFGVAGAGGRRPGSVRARRARRQSRGAEAGALTVAAAADRTVDLLAGGDQWWAVSAEDVTEELGVDPTVGLSSQHAQRLLDRDGPNALPAEPSVAAWRRFAGQYRSYIQIILAAAAIVSLAIQEWSTAVLLVAITVLNAVVGLRQEGK